MNSMALLYYLITIVDSLKDYAETVVFFCMFSLFILTLAFFLSSSKDTEGEKSINIFAKKWIKRAVILSVVISFFSAFTPSKKDMMVIAGLHVGQKGMQKVVAEAGEFYPLLKDVIRQKLINIKEEELKNVKVQKK